MADKLKLQVLTPEGKFVEDEVDEVTLPGILGELGFLPGHTHFITILKPGLLVFRKGVNIEQIQIGNGYTEIDNNNLVVLVKSAEKVNSTGKIA